MEQLVFYTADKPGGIKGKKLYKLFLKRIFSIEEIPFKKVSFIFCSDKFLLKLNNQHLNHNYYTDILTFSLSIELPVEAEIYISVDRIKENAKTFMVEYQKELLRVMIHGILHLCGYNDKSIKQIAIMREREEFYLQLFNLDFT